MEFDFSNLNEMNFLISQVLGTKVSKEDVPSFTSSNSLAWTLVSHMEKKGIQVSFTLHDEYVACVAEGKDLKRISMEKNFPKAVAKTFLKVLYKEKPKKPSEEEILKQVAPALIAARKEERWVAVSSFYSYRFFDKDVRKLEEKGYASTVKDKEFGLLLKLSSKGVKKLEEAISQR